MEKIGSILYCYEETSLQEPAEFDLHHLYPGSKWAESKKGKECFFEYVDEDGQTIKGETNEEWAALIELAKRTPNFTVEIHPRGERKCCKKATGEVSCCGKQETIKKCCPTKKETKSECKIPPKPQTKCSTKSGCCPMYEKEIPAEFSFDETITLNDLKVNPDLDKYKYSGDSLVAVALPLGPIGGGSIAIAGDGGLRQWQINNKVNHIAHVPNSFFAVKINNNAPTALQSSAHYDLSQFKPSPYITDHVVPDASKYLLSKIPGVKSVEVTAKFPVAEVAYQDDSIGGQNVSVTLEAWSPKIPHQSKESALPVIFFDFAVTNTGTKSVEVSLLGSLQNIVGWDGKTPITSEVMFEGYGNNTNSLMVSDKYYGLKMTNTGLDAKHQFNGEHSIFCFPNNGDNKSSMMQYETIESLWDAFKSNSVLPGQGVAGVSPTGKTFNGAINLIRTIEAGKTSTFTFAHVWHFPNRIKDWSFIDTIPNTDVDIGTYYSIVWKSLQEVINESVNTYVQNRDYTFKFRDSMFESSLPWQIVDSAAGRISVLNSPTCMWHADGNFYAFEGCSEQAGCCPLNCTHVWNYEMALAFLYPDVERTMRNIDLLHNITPWGVIPSRTPCPLEITRQWNNWKHYEMDQASTYICVDGEIGTVLKVYREIMNGGDKKWFDDMWPSVKLIMNRWLNVLDANKEGMIYGAQPNTYDVSIYGYNVFIGLLYLCALKATAVLANMQKDADFEKVCTDRFTLGSKNLDEKCYNGNWYVQVVDPNHQVQLMTDATIIGVLYGQWWAHILDLGYLLPKEHIQSHLLNTYKRNYVQSFDPATQKPRAFADKRDSGWVTGKWDQGKTPAKCLRYSLELAWSGVIYPFATMLLVEGFEKEGLHMLELTRQFYDGTRRSPWNEIECGDHYARPMSGFTLLTLTSGQKCKEDEAGYNVTFNPILNKKDFTGFFIFPTCWGSFTNKINSNDGLVKLSISHGELKLKNFSVPSPSQQIKSCAVFVNGASNMFCSHVKGEDQLKISFYKELVLKENDFLTVSFQM